MRYGLQDEREELSEGTARTANNKLINIKLLYKWQRGGLKVPALERGSQSILQHYHKLIIAVLSVSRVSHQVQYFTFYGIFNSAFPHFPKLDFSINIRQN